MSDIQLKPCPFCGCRAMVQEYIFLGKTSFYVCCDYCEAESKIATTSEEAAQVWNQRAEAGSGSKWIAVEDSLPGDDRMVLVWAVTKTGKGSVNRARHYANHWHGSGSMAGVTHWMEIPEGPRGERE